MRSQSVSEIKTDRTERIRNILAKRGLTLSQVSHESEALYGHSSPYFVPHNLYYDLRLETFSPSIYQLSALSRISGYRLEDWLRVFGVHPEDLTTLQALLPTNRTVLLDGSLDDRRAWLPWFRNRAGISATPPIAPLAQLLEFTQPRRLQSLSDVDNRTFLYVKIGQLDALAYPELLPGSIVRVNPTSPHILASLAPGSISDHIFLVEHGTGLCCSRLRISGDSRVALVSTQYPHPQRIELQLPYEATVRGVVDLEIRSLAAADPPMGLLEAAPLGRPEAFSSAQLGHLIRRARQKMALSFREVSALSRRIAELLGDAQYFISPSSLSDYETCDLSPRHIPKIITLCVLYGVSFTVFLRTAGIALEETGQDPIPDQLIRRLSPSGMRNSPGDIHEAEPGGFLGDLLGQFAEVPLFLRRPLAALSGLSTLSLHDFFWSGGKPDALHPYLRNTFLLVVNRRKKKLNCDFSKPAWQHPPYLLIERDGTYLVGSCGLENGLEVIYPDALENSKKLRYPHDAEVVGQIVTIVRKL